MEMSRECFRENPVRRRAGACSEPCVGGRRGRRGKHDPIVPRRTECQPRAGAGATPPKEARQALVDAQASVKARQPKVDISEKIITLEGREVPLTIVRPAGVTKTLPAFMYFHGGGRVLCDFQTHERLVHDLVVASGAAAVFVSYSPSPETRYPVAIN